MQGWHIRRRLSDMFSVHIGTFSIYGWARSRSFRKYVTYVMSSLIDQELAQPYLQIGPKSHRPHLLIIIDWQIGDHQLFWVIPQGLVHCRMYVLTMIWCRFPFGNFLMIQHQLLKVTRWVRDKMTTIFQWNFNNHILQTVKVGISIKSPLIFFLS